MELILNILSFQFGYWYNHRSNPTIKQVLKIDEPDALLASNFDPSKVVEFNT